MNRKTLAVSSLIGATIWTVLALAIHHHTQKWSETGQLMVIIVISSALIIGVLIGADRDQQKLDEEEMRMRENEAYGFEEDESTPPRAA